MSLTVDALPQPADVLAAAQRIKGGVHETPLLRSRALTALAGRETLVKCEHMQRTGSFKARGALNHLEQLRLAALPQGTGVVAASSGNHGQAVAWAAERAGRSATIVVPDTITNAKRRAIKGYGAELELVGSDPLERLERARELAAERGLVEIAPFDHPWTIEAQGTWLLEALNQSPISPETVVVPVSGGGLAAGTVLAARAAGWSGTIIGVEPASADDTRRSVRAGHRVRNKGTATIADALLAAEPGVLTFEINRVGLSDVVTVSDRQITTAMRYLLERTKQLVEPSGAAALAAIIAGAVVGDGPVLAILSGGNVGVDDLGDLMKPAGD